MEPLDFPRIVQLLDQCHGALMRVWNRYRDDMRQRGFETQDARNEVALRCLTNMAQFRGNTAARFCEWSLTILENWIRHELERHRPGQLLTDFEADDSRQPRPSEVRQDIYRRLTYLVARDQLTDAERALVAAQYENPITTPGIPRPRLPKPDEVRAFLQLKHGDIWAQHANEWAGDDALISDCEAAWERLYQMAAALDLENRGTPNE